MNIKTIIGALALAMTSAASMAAVVDFEDIAVGNGGNSIGGDRVSGGFVFDSLANHTHLANNSFRGNSGSTFLVTDGFAGANRTTMSAQGGSLFSISSLQLGEWNDGIELATQVTATGNLSGGGTIQQAFTLDGVLSTGGSNNFETFLFGAGWTNLTSVSFEATAGTGSRYWAMDNIVVNAATNNVPEPASMALLGLGLAGLAGLRRRKN